MAPQVQEANTAFLRPRTGETPRPASVLARAGAAICCLALATSAAAAPRQIVLSPPDTSVAFTSYAMGLFAITGHFTRFTGHLLIDPGNPQDCTVALQIDVASLEMADPARARLATGPKMLDQPHFPMLAYQGSCAHGHAAGLLTMHGQTRSLELTASRSGPRVTAIGTLRRQDYGIDGLPGLVGRTIKLTFAVSLPDELADLIDP